MWNGKKQQLYFKDNETRNYIGALQCRKCVTASKYAIMICSIWYQVPVINLQWCALYSATWSDILIYYLYAVNHHVVLVEEKHPTWAMSWLFKSRNKLLTWNGSWRSGCVRPQEVVWNVLFCVNKTLLRLWRVPLLLSSHHDGAVALFGH